MSGYALFDEAGTLIQQGFAPAAALDALENTSSGFLRTDGMLPAGYLLDGVFVPRPAQPSPYHTWNASAKSWEESETALSAATVATLGRLSEAFYSRSQAPVVLAGVPFDADDTARARISGMLGRLARGDGLPPDWAGWRDADNAMHWGGADAADVLLHLRGLATAIEDREQSLLVALWGHKAALGSAATVEQIAGYDAASGWP